MAHWGIAYGAGPFYNQPWCDFGEAEVAECTALCFDHIKQAQKLSTNCTASEVAMIEALARRFQQPNTVSQGEFNRWDDDYADAMRQVDKAFPNDLDVMALFAEAMMTRTPWKLWNVKTGEPTDGADTHEALEVLERAIALADERDEPPHPAIVHLHIHALEMSTEPERALRSADDLRELCPDGGHMNHMPAHIYVLLGEYKKSKIASERAISADNKYVDYAGAFNFYTTARCHDLHMQMYTCMFLGQYEPAIKAADQMCETLSFDVLSMKGRPQMAVTMEGYYAMKMHVMVRFGRWQEIADATMPPCADLYCVSTAMHHYAKGVALAALKRIDEAEEQRGLFYASLKRIPPNRKFFNNLASTTLGIGEKMLEGELEYHKGNFEVAYERLRESVRRDDDLEYTEPWAWMHPPRHALAALLMEQGHFEEAEEIYRADLGLDDTLQRCAQHPKNVWALHGLVECLRQRGGAEELPEFENQLIEAQSQTDVPITSSCLCRMKVANG
ncbi:MAG: hypothetical protein V3V02_07505 [Rhizobiaceae bacterium]